MAIFLIVDILHARHIRACFEFQGKSFLSLHYSFYVH